MLRKAATRLFVASLVSIALWAQDPKPTADTVKLSLPDEKWSLVLELPGFAVEKNEIEPDGRRYLLAENSTTGITLSADLEREKAPTDMAGCKASLEARAKAAKSLKSVGVSISEMSGMKVLEYLVPESEGRKVRQKNYFVCIPKEDVFVDLHLSKTAWQIDQQRLFMLILANLRFEPTPPASTSP